MPRLNAYARQRIVTLKQQGKTIIAIRSALEEEDIVCSRQSISAFWKTWLETSSLKGRHGGGCKRKLSQEHLDYMDTKLRENNELTGKELKSLIHEEFGLTVSLPTILRWRKNIGWVYAKTRYCQMVSAKNKPLRMEFAKKCLEEEDHFLDVIFTDETKIQLSSHVRYQCHKKGDPVHNQLRPVPKHPYQVSLHFFYRGKFYLHAPGLPLEK